MKKLLLTMTLLVLVLGGVSAQTTPDPAIQQAKEETAVIYDLGRFFGYVLQMHKEEPKLALSADQKGEIAGYIEEIRSMSRIEVPWAEETLEYLELDLLSPAQLLKVDQLAIAWQSSRTSSGTGTGTGGGSGGGPIASYVAGGPFNPIVDESKSIGANMKELYDLISD